MSCGSSGSSQQQNQVSNEQAAYYQTIQQQQAQAYSGQQAILDSLKQAWAPVLAAGPSQQGFSADQRNALNTQAIEGTGAEYQKASQAVRELQAARGGGNQVLPSGVDEQQQAQIASAAAGDQASKRLNIVNADYAAGRANFSDATSALAGAAGMYAPTSYASAANQAGQNAFGSATQVQQMNNQGSFWNTIGGVLGGAAGAFLGGSGGFLGTAGKGLAGNMGLG